MGVIGVNLLIGYCQKLHELKNVLDKFLLPKNCQVWSEIELFVHTNARVL